MPNPLPTNNGHSRVPPGIAQHLERHENLPPAEPALEPAKLLIVDDEEGPRESLKLIFKTEYQLFSAHNAATALEILRRERIDVAILDIRMPGGSGLDLLEQAKQVDPDIEVIMLTAFETPEYLRQALKLRACDYLNKPFELGTIRKAVAKAVDRRMITRELLTSQNKLRDLQEEIERVKIASESAKTRGEIYASIIHDINGPLTIISGLVQIINQRLNQDSELMTEDVEVVRDRFRRVTRQVTSVIEISRRYLRLLKPNSQQAGKVWVNQVLVDLEDLVRGLPDARSHNLVISPLAQDAIALVSSIDLIQMLLNLTINALQCAKNPHRVEIRAQLLAKPLDLSLFQDGPTERFMNRESFQNQTPILALSVLDDGPGMSPEVLSKIFEPYFSAQPGGRGSGIGLTIVYRLLREAQGGLHVQSEQGRGSVFTLYLRARPPQEPPLANRSPLPPSSTL